MADYTVFLSKHLTWLGFKASLSVYSRLHKQYQTITVFQPNRAPSKTFVSRGLKYLMSVWKSRFVAPSPSKHKTQQKCVEIVCLQSDVVRHWNKREIGGWGGCPIMEAGPLAVSGAGPGAAKAGIALALASPGT